MNEPIFKDAFDVAKVANFNQKQLDSYEQSLKEYRDYHNTMDSAINSAVNTKTKETIIRSLNGGKLSVEDIADYNDVSIELVVQIQAAINRNNE